MAAKLERIASYGPYAAYVSAGAMLVFLVLQVFGNSIAPSIPRILVLVGAILYLSLVLWTAGLAIVLLDLGGRTQRASSMRRFQVARWAILIAMLMPVPLIIGVIVGAGVLVQSPALCLLYGGAGISLLLHSVEARRSGRLHGVLPWLGIVIGVAFLVGGVGFGTFLVPGVGMVLYMVGLSTLELGEALYAVWAIWVGTMLSRSQAAAPATA